MGEIFRQKEMEWLHRHHGELSHYANQWIAIEGNELIAANPDLTEVMAKAQAKGITVPFVLFVPMTQSTPFMGL